jgi:hypothetical protein
MEIILSLLRPRLAPLDFVSRREVLRALVRNGAVLALLTGRDGWLRVAAAQRTSISAQALNAPVPDGQFQDYRLLLAEGQDAVLLGIAEDIIATIQIEGGVVGKVIINPRGGSSGPTREPGGGMEGAITACSATYCDKNWGGCDGAHTCEEHSCTSEYCDDHACGEDDCATQLCGENLCAEDEGCHREGCEDRNVCGERNSDCGGRETCNAFRCTGTNSAAGWMSPHDFLDRYQGEPFVRELKELFGRDVEFEIESMIRNGTTLRGRGFLGGPPPPPTGRSLKHELRDLPGTRLLGPRGLQPGAPPSAVPAPRVAPGAVSPGRAPSSPAAPTSPATPGPPATTTPPAIGPTPGTTPTPPTVDPRRLQPPGGGPGSAVPAPQPKAPLQ